MSTSVSMGNTDVRGIPKPLRSLARHPLACLALAATLSVAAFIAYRSASGVLAGFPLDDAWIHQTYARNLALYGQLAYTPGVPSAGSTSPLWTLLLGLGYLLGLPHVAWAVMLGWAALVATGWGAFRLTRALAPGRDGLALTLGAFCATEWHLVWAALSGMETLLFTALALALLARAVGPRPALYRPWVADGLIGGALILTRPEGVLLVALVAAHAWAKVLQARMPSSSVKRHLGSTLCLIGGCAIPLVPYIAFNMWASGSPLPNTFYAKQAEYRTLIEAGPLVVRWVRVVFPTLVGAQILLVVGMAWEVARSASLSLARWMGRDAAGQGSALPAAYWLVFTLVYAARLPVTYQHGRYLMPTIPLLIVLGGIGTARLIAKLRETGAVRWVMTRFLSLSGILLTLGFTVIGARAWTTDIAVINGEMVDAAHWLRENTPAGALVAAHDIGAIGYFADRPLLDLAGLVTPEVVPFMRDEEALADFIVARGAAYLVTFPSWYPTMVSLPQMELVYQTDCEASRTLGSDNMAVYHIRQAGG